MFSKNPEKAAAKSHLRRVKKTKDAERTEQAKRLLDETK